MGLTQKCWELAKNVTWQRRITNEVLYAGLPRISTTIEERYLAGGVKLKLLAIWFCGNRSMAKGTSEDRLAHLLIYWRRTLGSPETACRQWWVTGLAGEREPRGINWGCLSSSSSTLCIHRPLLRYFKYAQTTFSWAYVYIDRSFVTLSTHRQLLYYLKYKETALAVLLVHVDRTSVTLVYTDRSCSTLSTRRPLFQCFMYTQAALALP